MAKKKKKKREIRNYDPAIDTGINRPVAARIAVRDINDKYSDYPSRGLTPVRLAKILQEADEGNVRAQMELFEDIEEKDAHVFSQLQTRKLAVIGLDWEIQPCSEEERDQRIADFVKEQLEGLENFGNVLLDLLDAIGKGISIMELEWGVDSDGYDVIEDIEHVHPKKLIWDYQTDEMKICTREYPEGLSIPGNKFVVHQYKAKSGHASRAGIFRIIAWMYMFKNFDIKDWVSFCEVFGMPLRLGKYDASASEDDKKQLMDAIVSLGTDAAGVVPTSTMIEFIESNKTASADIYERLARYCDEQNSKAIVGQTLTADSGGGSYAQSKTHNEVRHDLTVADANALSITIRRDIIRPLVEFNFGRDIGIPKIKFACEEPEDLKQLAAIYKELQEMGVEIPEDHVYEKFNIPKPEEGQKVLVPRENHTVMRHSETETALKEETIWDTEENQAQVDEIVAMSSELSKELFREMFRPILREIDNCDDLISLRDTLKDEKKLKELYSEMDSIELEDLISQGIYLSKLVGRTMES